MVDGEKRQSRPFIPRTNWFALRTRFINSLPTRVNAAYLRGALDIQNGYAQQLLRYLQQIGLLDESGAPTDLARDWRSEDHYAAVCEKIREQVFPLTLRELFPCGEFDRPKIQNWLMHHDRLGRMAAGRLATFYQLLCEADPTIGPDTRTSNSNMGMGGATPSSSKTKSTRAGASKKTVRPSDVESPDTTHDRRQRENVMSILSPDLHINIQIHISADATAEQVDYIFASMARHLVTTNQGARH